MRHNSLSEEQVLPSVDLQIVNLLSDLDDEEGEVSVLSVVLQVFTLQFSL